MEDLTLLRDLVVLVVVAVPMAGLAQRLRAPTLAAFLLTGVLIGPNALGLIRDPESVSALAELGVVLLLFTIGLELSVSRVYRLAGTVLRGGGLQVVLTLGVVAAAAVALGSAGRTAVLYGALAALSSTAIVLKVLENRSELDTPHGRVMLAILLFQDFCVVPLMLLLPVLAGRAGGVESAFRHTALSLAVVAALVLAGRFLVPPLLRRVVGLRNREIFTLSIVLFGVGAAFLTAWFGLSLALGAFVAGLVVSESEYGLQALSDVLPFRDTFGAIFFTSIGMLLDPAFVAERPVLVLACALGLILVKAAVASGVTLALRRSLATSVRVGLGLAQVGEFSFVLATVAAPLGLLDARGRQLFIAVSVLSMVATPFLIAASRRIGERLQDVARGSPIPEDAEESAALDALSDHVVIVGYGVNGRSVARALRAARIPYVVLEQNGQAVRRARRAGEPIYFGDGTRHEVLRKVGTERARVFVLAIASAEDERRGVAVARDLGPRLRIVVRTRYIAEIDELRRLGADHVVPEEFGTALEIFARVLALYDVPATVVSREVDALRGEHYEMLRSWALPSTRLEELEHLRLEGTLDTLHVRAGAPADGASAASLRLRERTGVTVIAVVREGRAVPSPPADFAFRAGDTVLVIGDRDALHRGMEVFRG